MNATGWALTIGSVLPWLVVLIGCIIFAAKAKSCSSMMLVLAAIGEFVMAVFAPVYRRYIYPELIRNADFDLFQAVDIGVNVLSIIAGLFFAVMLLVVLLGKARAPKAAPVPQPVTIPTPVPAPQPAPPVPPSGPPYAPPPPPQAESEQ